MIVRSRAELKRAADLHAHGRKCEAESLKSGRYGVTVRQNCASGLSIPVARVVDRALHVDAAGDERSVGQPRIYADIEPLVLIDVTPPKFRANVLLFCTSGRSGLDVVQPAHRITAATRQIRHWTAP